MSKQYEEEIEQILNRLGGLKVPRSPKYGLTKLLLLYLSQRLRAVRMISPGVVMLIGVAFIVAAVSLQSRTHKLSLSLMAIGVVVLVAGYGIAIISGAVSSLPRSAKQWRGRPVDSDVGEDDW